MLVIPSSTNNLDERTSTPNGAHTTVTFKANRTTSLPTPVYSNPEETTSALQLPQKHISHMGGCAKNPSHRLSHWEDAALTCQSRTMCAHQGLRTRYIHSPLHPCKMFSTDTAERAATKAGKVTFTWLILLSLASLSELIRTTWQVVSSCRHF